MQTIEKILKSILPIKNPQGEEKEVSDAILNLITEIPFPEISDVEFNSKWGLYFKIKSSETNRSKNGILFLGHMDSNDYSTEFTIENGYAKSAGLDNKAGLSSILYVLHLIKEQKKSFPYDIHVYFSVMEEVGQKGAMYFPLEKIQGKVRYGISVDRKTNESGGGGIRHFINSYHGVSMLIPGDATFLEDTLGCKGVPSPNCADIIEMRGRFDAEIIYPNLVGKNDGKIENYNKWTSEIKDRIEDTEKPLPFNRAVCSMYETPRRDRYEAMGAIYEALYKSNLTIPDSHKLSVVNLSLDFSDPKIAIKEIEDTSEILLNFLDKYAES